MHELQEELQLIPAFIDNAARTEPDRVIASIAKTNEVSDGFRDVTVLELANAINRAAWFIRQSVGPSSSFDTLTYIGPSDLCYPIIAIAAAKVGYKTFWTSPRNSFEAHKSLLRETNCKILATPAQVPPGIGPVLEAIKLHHLVFPPVSHWLEPGIVEQYSFEKTYAESKEEPFLVQHTSGTTGIPKTVVQPFGNFTCSYLYTLFPEEDGTKSMIQWIIEQGGRILSPFPMFHGAGIFLFFSFGFYWNVVPVLPPPRPITAELVDEIHRSGEVSCSLIPPSILEDISEDPNMLESLHRLKYVMYLSAPLSEAAGRIVSQHVRILQKYAQTETGFLYQLMVDPEDYRYVRYGSINNMEFRHRYDDLHEGVVVRKPGLEDTQPGFMGFPEDVREIFTRDLFASHPDPRKAKTHFIHRGRADDVIVFDTGEKLNPVTMEDTIAAHPKVLAALIVGQGRFQSAILIQPRGENPTTDEDKKAFIEEIWPTIEEANRTCPAHGRLVNELVILTPPGKSLEITFKGKPSRRNNVKFFADEINAAYAHVSAAQTAEALNLDVSDAELQDQIRTIVVKITGIDTLADHMDFYSSGADSLQTLQLSRALNAAFAASNAPEVRVPPSLIYRNPTVLKLSAAILAMLRPNGVVSNGVDARAAEIEAAISRYMPNLCVTSPKVLLLTGSTGNLGSYLLGSLMRCHSVQKIYCLNRSSEAAERQAKGNALRGLPCTREDSRVVFLQFDASRKDLGLAPDVQKEILATATDIIHNAWTVDFNRSLSSFHPNIAGVRHLVEFAQKSPSKPSIFFVSSVGTARRWADAGNAGSIPEEIAADISIVDYGGYPESKYIAERLLQEAWTRTSLKICVLRVGQIAGPVRSLQGQWNPVEWLPTIIQSSARMGMLPQTIGSLDVVDWIPVDILSDVVTEILHQDRKNVSKFPVYNLVNPFQTTWQALVPKIRETLTASTGKEIRLVEYSEWLSGLQKASLTLHTDEELRRVPGVKLLDFFESIPYGMTGPTATWSTKMAQQASKTLKECTAVTTEWMDLWMRQWGYTVNKATF